MLDNTFSTSYENKTHYFTESTILSSNEKFKEHNEYQQEADNKSQEKKKEVHKYNQHHITLDLASPILSYAFQHKSPHRTIPYFFVSSIFPCQLFSFKLNQAQNSAHLFLPILLFQPAYVLTTTVYPTLSLALQLLLVFLLSNEDIKELVKRISQNPIVDQLTSHSCILQ